LRSDQDILSKVNMLARMLVWMDGSSPPPRCDLSRVMFVSERWCRAVTAHKKITGDDAQAALVRHEAWLRSSENAPELHIERR
jgi:hypothetical protein